jgi:hypothetical protein
MATTSAPMLDNYTMVSSLLTLMTWYSLETTPITHSTWETTLSTRLLSNMKRTRNVPFAEARRLISR